LEKGKCGVFCLKDELSSEYVAATSVGFLQVSGGASSLAFLPLLFFIIVVLIIVVAIARGVSGRNRVQRPLSGVTAFPPPPPPDTAMIMCEYCGTEQIWKENCVKCGAPMPKP